MVQLLMPMATAVWLVDNTTLTFRQIAKFCNLHELEVQGIADGAVAANMAGVDPTLGGQLTREEITRCEQDPDADLVLVADEIETAPRTKGPRYTPVSKRQDKPAAIAWLLRHHPELSDNQICKLIGTTKPTINAIRSKSHWNMSNIQPQDPVSLGLCRQQELDAMVQKMAHKKAAAAESAREDP
ncbi:MAG TPA: cell cycle transcriptional regulator TrcR, partial [Sphingomonadales bacterium]|nr:cell cycle transcriptional regulator TrcR [Sphingomonadales bacterium]